MEYVNGKLRDNETSVCLRSIGENILVGCYIDYLAIMQTPKATAAVAPKRPKLCPDSRYILLEALKS